jgi:hypothetical protein
MKFPWFKRIGIFFAFAVYSFLDIDGKSHSVSDTLMNFVFMLLIIGAIYSLIAYLTSRVWKK